ncbi:inactive ubiquitin thioesterase OTULINL [Pseudophryne corroboree]|uniref:inactive ubiquitin thioesterase OTULINL n=1 Tax=Pseudophryne corroboree TaxID=495146 RepID=UPI0030817B62
MALSGQGDNNHKEEMPYRRHHVVPGSPAQPSAAETHDERSRLHDVMKKVWNQVHQCLVLAVAVPFAMWKHFKALISVWCSISCQGQSRNKRNLSVNAEVSVLSYCSTKWKGEALCVMEIRKAYEDIFWKHHIKTLQHVKEDNYCVLRAVLFQVFSQGIPFPGWMKEKDILKLPEMLLYAQGCNWIQQFSFGPEKYSGPKVYAKLRSCVELFKKQWAAFYSCKDRGERNRMCKLVFSDDAKENKLYEALKFIMLYLVIEAYENRNTDQHFTRFFHFLFSRDTSADPLSYMMNHLNSVGDTVGVEQVEMCLVGYALELRIKVFQLSKMNTEDFERIYPEDYKRDWHEIILMTDDNRHYNIPIISK